LQIGERIGQFPHGYQEVAERPGVRRVPMVRYPYLIFYKVQDDEVVVLRIVHGARKEPWEIL
jgi:plasmid stabilization system protein ParE